MDIRPLIITAALASVPLCAQVSYTTPGELYTQDFTHPDGAGTEPVEWVDNETFPGWFAAYHDGKRDVYETPATVFPTSGTGRSNVAFYLYRTDDNPADTALGSQPTDARCPGFGMGGIYYGVNILNNTGQRLETLRLKYRVEQYRVTTTPDVQITLNASYRVGGDGIGGEGGIWAMVPGSTYTTPLAGGGDGTLSRSVDGNLEGNRVPFEDLVVKGLALEPGQSLWLRWFDVNNRFADHGVGIDDVGIVLEP